MYYAFKGGIITGLKSYMRHLVYPESGGPLDALNAELQTVSR
uniref:Uncharacterized protein n=1 Tax=Anguilla anguilla TaxID=7936 RepID=A0A0E9T4M9_ANGAN